MELVFRQIEEVVKISENNFVLCRIHVVPREIYSSKGQNKPYLSHRWMSEVDWAAFDKAIERLINSNSEKRKTMVLSSNPILLDIERIDGDTPTSFMGIQVTKVLICKIKFLNASNEQQFVEMANDLFTASKNNDAQIRDSSMERENSERREVDEKSQEKDTHSKIYSPKNVEMKNDDALNESKVTTFTTDLKDVLQTAPGVTVLNNKILQHSSEQDCNSTTAPGCNNVEMETSLERNDMLSEKKGFWGTADFNKLNKRARVINISQPSSKYDRNALMETESNPKNLENEISEALNRSVNSPIELKEFTEKTFGKSIKHLSKCSTEEDGSASDTEYCNKCEEKESGKALNEGKNYVSPDLRAVFQKTPIKIERNKDIFQLFSEQDCNRVKSTVYSASDEEMEFSLGSNDSLKSHESVEGSIDVQKVNQKTSRRHDCNSANTAEYSPNSIEMETDDALIDSKDITDLRYAVEKTPDKGEINHKQRETKILSPQSVRRSARSFVKPKRYDNDDYIGSNKRIRSSHNNNHKSKPSPKKKPTSTPDLQNKTGAIYKIQKLSKWHINKKMQDVFKEFSSQWQPKQPLLTLNDMTIAQVMETFESNRSRLDALFQKVYHMGFVKTYEGIDHYLVIDLLPNEVQKAMMTKLSDYYETGDIPKYHTHCANLLMPEWILSIFNARYNMTREESIARIKEQNSFSMKPLDWKDQEENK